MSTVEKLNQESGKTDDSRAGALYSQTNCWYRIFCRRPTSADQDKGSAWLLLCFCVISNIMSVGAMYGTYGTMNIILQKHFYISVNESSFICSLNTCFWLCTAPIASVLTKKLGCRTIQIAGGLLLMVGMGGCAFATEIWQVYILYAVFAALGASACYVTVPGVLVHHFRRHKYMAFSISICGSRVGNMSWASISQLMFTRIGFSLTMGIIGLLEILAVLGGLFMTEQRSLLQDGEEEALLSSKEDSKTQKDMELSEMHKTDDKIQESSKEEEFHVLQGLKTLASDWTVWFLLLSFGLWSINSHGFYFFINDYVVKYANISEAAAALGVSIFGIGTIVGCLVTIGVSNLEFDRVLFQTPLSSIFGITTIFMGFTNGLVMFYSLTFTFGLSFGLTTSNMFAVCYAFHGADLLNILFGICMCAQGITGLVTGPICAYLQTNVHYTAGIIFAGSTGIAASVVLIPVLVKRRHNHRSK